MPYKIVMGVKDGRQSHNVVNLESGKVYHHATMAKAEAQLRLLRGIEHGMIPRR